VFDPAKTEVKEDDQFYIAFNKQTGRFERISNKVEESRFAIGVTTASFIAGASSGNSTFLVMTVQRSTDRELVGTSISIAAYYVMTSASIGVGVKVVAVEREFYVSSAADAQPTKAWVVVERSCE
jgi:hypothetical protein